MHLLFKLTLLSSFTSFDSVFVVELFNSNLHPFQKEKENLDAIGVYIWPGMWLAGNRGNLREKKVRASF